MNQQAHPVEGENNLRAVREKANTYCLQQLLGLQQEGRALEAEMVAARGDRLAELKRKEVECRREFVIFAVRGSVLSGRLPEADEAAAMARCADDEGMTAFLNEMSRLPVGFVDMPAQRSRHN